MADYATVTNKINTLIDDNGQSTAAEVRETLHEIKDYIQQTQPAQATQTIKGIAEIATQTEVNSGTDNTRIVTPKTLTDADFARTRVFGYVHLGNLPSANPIASGDINSAAAISYSAGSPDSRVRLSFNSVGTSQYTPIVYIESLHSDYDIDNDTIVSIKNVQSTSFDVLLREVETPAQNVRLRVQIII